MELLDNILALTNSELDLNLITIAGVKLGYHKDSIPTKIITEESGRGWLQTNQDIVIRTSTKAPKIVVEFLLKSNILLPLKISKKKNIEKIFGKASAIEQRSGSTYYFYENRKMVISWHNSDNQLYGIYLGDNIIQQTQFTVRDFLNKYYEFKDMVPNSNNWNLKSLQYNEPRFYRLKELQAMLLAFDIGKDLTQDFLLLGFLNRRTVEDLAPIIDDIEEYVSDSEFEKERWVIEKDRWNNIVPYKMLLQNFLRFSAEVRVFLQFNNSWLEAGSVISRYTIYKTQRLINSVDVNMLHEIELLLCKLLDPQQRTFTKSYLIQHYNYPNVDLHSIDLENY